MLRDFLLGGGTVSHAALTAPVRAAYWAPHRQAADRAGVLAFPLQIPRPTSEPIAQCSAAVARELHETLTATPSLLLWGMKDYLFDATTLASWVDFRPHATVMRLEQAGQPLCAGRCSAIGRIRYHQGDSLTSGAEGGRDLSRPSFVPRPYPALPVQLVPSGKMEAGDGRLQPGRAGSLRHRPLLGARAGLDQRHPIFRWGPRGGLDLRSRRRSGLRSVAQMAKGDPRLRLRLAAPLLLHHPPSALFPHLAQGRQHAMARRVIDVVPPFASDGDLLAFVRLLSTQIQPVAVLSLAGPAGGS
nr:hypothetical protein [Thermogemmatispora aurantia]